MLRCYVLESDCVMEGGIRVLYVMYDVLMLGVFVIFLVLLWLINLCLKLGIWVFFYILIIVISEICKFLLIFINI